MASEKKAPVKFHDREPFSVEPSLPESAFKIAYGLA